MFLYFFSEERERGRMSAHHEEVDLMTRGTVNQIGFSNCVGTGDRNPTYLGRIDLGLLEEPGLMTPGDGMSDQTGNVGFYKL